MAVISKIKLPDNNTYDLHDNTGTYIKKAGDTVNANAILTPSTSGTIVTQSPTALYQSPVPKYLWHDLWAFCKATTPKFYRTTNGSTWTEATVDKGLFAQKEARRTEIINSTYSGARWEWDGGGFAYCNGYWMCIGVTYNQSYAHFDVLLEHSSGTGESATWTTLAHVTNVNVNQAPVWIKTDNPSTNNLRLTITRNSSSANTTIMSISALKYLSARWGDQGKGSEYEFPYEWGDNGSIYPLANSSVDLGSTGKYWKNGYFTNINGVAVGSSPKFTDHTYTANTSKLVTTTVPNVTNKGTVPSLTITSTACDDITGWTTNTPTSASVSGGILTISIGTAADLDYTARSVGSASGWNAGSTPTLGTAITVATGSLASNGGGGTVATGITAS